MKLVRFCGYLVGLLLIIIDVTYGYCSATQTSSACTAQTQCTFDSTSQVCGCGVNFKQDIIFIVDGTNALSTANFLKVKQFLNQTVKYAIPSSSTNTRIGLYQYIASTSSPAYVTHQSLTSGATQAQTISAINQMSSQQADSTKADANSVVGAAITSFNSASTTQRRVMIIITAEVSTLEVCSKAPREADIFTYVITIGSGWTTKKYQCLVSDRDKGNSFIELSTASDLTSSSTTLNKLEDLMCPTKPIVKITEVKAVASGSGAPRFVELKNYGGTITLSSSNALKLTGFWPNGITPSPSVSWTQGQYLVVFNGVDSGAPDCNGCACTNNGQTPRMCTAALYLGCCPSCTVTSPAVKVTSCGTFSTTVTQTSWSITAIIGSVTVDTVTFGSDYYWPTTGSVFPDYTYELVYPLFVSSWGSSWALSCNTKGTPGYTHSRCTCSSLTSCNVNGTNGLACNSGVCHCADGYYPNEQTCDRFPRVSSCTALVKANPATGTVDYSWPLANWDRQHQYKVRYCPASGGDCTGTVTAFGVIKTQSSISYSPNPGWLSVTWQNNTLYQSAYTTCTLATITPTTQPTKAPTYHRPNITSCNYTLNQARSQYVAKWSYPIGQDVAALGNPSEYRLYHNGVLKATAPTRTATVTVSNFDVLTTVVEVEGYWSGTPSYTTYKKKCTGYTQAPTRTPTKKPTRHPTKKPTKKPTRRPTASPVYKKLNTSNCVIEYLSGHTKSALIHYASPYYHYPQTVTANDTVFDLSFYCNDTILDTWSATISEPVERPLGVQYNPLRHTACLRPTWTEHGSTTVHGDFVTCVVTTEGPTPSPTRTPTDAPSPSPTWSPTDAPTRRPTLEPTPSPTFEGISVDWCDFQLESGNSYGIAYFPTVDIDYPKTPNASEIFYSFLFTLTGKTQVYPPVNPLAQNSPKLKCLLPNETLPCTVYHEVVNEISPAFVYGTNKVEMTVSFTDLYDSGGSKEKTITCNVLTAAPSKSPTRSPSFSPTSAPTAGPVHVYITAPMCDDSLKKADNTTWGNPPNAETRNSERCGCNTWDDDDNCKPIVPVVVVSESEDLTSITVKRNDPSYVYDLRITFAVGFVNLTTAKNDTFNDTLRLYNRVFFNNNPNQSVYADIPPDSWYTPEHIKQPNLGEMGPSKADITTWNGTFYIRGGSDRNGKLLLDIIREFPPDELLKYSTDLPNEVFLLTLTSCVVINNQTRAGAQENDIRECILAYPETVFLIVQDGDKRNVENSLTTPNKSYQSWLWYVLGGIGVFLAVVGFMAYRWWVNNKMKQAEVKQADEDIDAVIQEQEEGFGNDLDQVAVNPLAQPFTHLQGPTTKDFNTDDNDAEDGMTEKAEVRTEKIKFKQEFGPSQATKKN